ncbi:glycosyltransferase family 8 protein, partial [Patellaria atrata CBS 101060]
IPQNCAYTTQHASPLTAQTTAAPALTGLGMPNGGLQVVNPSQTLYTQILSTLSSSSALNYEFADQSLLSDLYKGRWVPLPYVYNALKTLRWKGVHDVIWRDGEVRNLHLILSPKPWDEKRGEGKGEETSEMWWGVNGERLEVERGRGIEDGY